MTQLSLKAGLKEWVEEAFTAAQSDMKQLHFRNTFKTKHWRELSQVQRQTVLESHMFLKQKRDGNIKGRTVAGGNKQGEYISKADASLPTVATESVLLSCIIDAEEEWEVAVVDIPNPFVQTRVENEKDMAFIKIRGILVDILVEIAPDVFKSYVSKDKKGTKQLLVQCQNALYGTRVRTHIWVTTRVVRPCIYLCRGSVEFGILRKRTFTTAPHNTAQNYDLIIRQDKHRSRQPR
jgi:hypothetical protein